MKPSQQRILFCRSNPIAPDPRVEKEAKALLKANFPVAVIGWDRTASLPIQEDIFGIHIERISIKAPFAAGMMNLHNLLRWEILLFRWLGKHRNDFDIIHACDFDTILPALWAKRLWGKQVVYDIFDFYADHLRRTPNFIKAMIRKQDLAAIGEADAVILCDDARIDQINGSKPHRVEIIYNAPEDTPLTIEPNPHSAGTLCLGYVGLIQVERGLLDVIDILQQHPEWHLDLAGFGGDEQQILSIISSMPNITWHGRVPYDRAMEINQAADVMFALYDPAIPNHRYSSANKIFEAMMLSKPVLVAENTNMDRIIAEHRCGLVVPYGDRPKIETALTKLAKDPVLSMQLGRNGRKAYESQFAWAVMEKRLTDLYRKIAP